jgi:hypothetical protein
MLPNFTVVICGALLTVLMLAVAGSGLIDPETRTRVGAMPEISRPMMQRMITEPARGQFAAIEMSRRAEALMRLRDLAPSTAEQAPAAELDEPAQPGVEPGAPAPQSALPPDTAVPAASNEPAPTAGAQVVSAAEAAPAADAAAAPGAAAAPDAATVIPLAAPPAVAEQAAAPAAVAEDAPAPDSTGAPAAQDSRLAAEPAAEPPPASPIGTGSAPPAAAPVRIAAAPLGEPPAVLEHDEPVGEMPASPSLALALAEPTAVSTEEAPAKPSTRAAEPEGAMPVRRLMPRFVPLLPRVIPSLARHATPRLAPSAPRVTPMLARHAHIKAKADAGKPDIAKAAMAPRKPVRHAIRQAQHRAQRTYVAPYSAYGATPGAQYNAGVQYK